MDQRLFLGAGPAFELALASNGVRGPIECLGPDQFDGATAAGVVAADAVLMLRDTGSNVLSAMRTNVVGSLSAADHVDPDKHRASFEARFASTSG
jgi:hypothetical protein